MLRIADAFASAPLRGHPRERNDPMGSVAPICISATGNRYKEEE